MSSIEKWCLQLYTQITQAQANIALPKDEQLLLVLLRDPVIYNSVKNVVLNEPRTLEAARLRFNSALHDWAKNKFDLDFTPEDKTRDAILFFCIGIQRAVDDIADIPSCFTETLNFLRKIYEFDMNFSRPCNTLFSGIFAEDDFLPLMRVAGPLLAEKQLAVANRLSDEMQVVFEKLSQHPMDEVLMEFADEHYVGSDVLQRLKMNLTRLQGSVPKNPNASIENILPKLSSTVLVEAVFHLIIKKEPELCQEEIKLNLQHSNALKARVSGDMPDLKNQEFINQIGHLRSSRKFLIARLLADPSVKLAGEALNFFAPELNNPLLKSADALLGPEQSDLRSAINLVNCVTEKTNGYYREYLLNALECVLSDRPDFHEELNKVLLRVNQVPADVTTIFTKVKLFNKLLPVLNELLYAPQAETTRRAEECRTILVRANIASKQKLQMMVMVANQYAVVNNLMVTLVTLGWVKRTEQSLIFKVLQGLEPNKIDSLRAALEQLSDLAAVNKALAVFEKHGVIGQLNAIDTFVKAERFAITLDPAKTPVSDLEKKRDAITVMQAMLSNVEAALVPAEYFSATTVAPAREHAGRFCTILSDLLEDTYLQLLRVKAQCFQEKYQDCAMASSQFMTDLEELRALYFQHLPNKDKMPAVNKALYDKVIDELAVQINNFSELEENLPRAYQPS